MYVDVCGWGGGWGGGGGVTGSISFGLTAVRVHRVESTCRLAMRTFSDDNLF